MSRRTMLKSVSSDMLRQSKSIPAYEYRRGGGLRQGFDRSIVAQTRNLRKSASTSYEGDHVIRPPSFRPPSGPSNTRPVPNEPGSKMENFHPQGTKSKHPQHLQGEQLDIVNELLQDARSMEKCAPHEEVIQPSAKTTERLNRITGRPLGRPQYQHQYSPKMDDVDVSVGLEKRGRSKNQLLHKRCSNARSLSLPEFSDDQTECSGSVATVSDLDNLAAKSLRRGMSAYPLGRRQVSVLRREIKEMVGSSLDERDAVEGKNKNDQAGTTTSQQKGREVRESTEETKERGKVESPRSEAASRGEPCLMWCDRPPSSLEEFVNGLRYICVNAVH